MKGFARGVNLEMAYSELQSITDNNCPSSPKKGVWNGRESKLRFEDNLNSDWVASLQN